MRRGEVWWHEPPDSKRRPVLILTRDEAVDRVFNVIDRSRLQRDRGPGDGHCPRSCNGGRDRTRRWDADRVRACARQHPLRRKGVPDRAHHDAWPGEDGRGLLGARHGDELPLTDAYSVPCSRSIAAIVSWFKYRPVRAMKVAGSESCTSPRTLAKAANILGFWFSRSRLFPAVLGTRTANGPQRRAKGTASDTVRCLTPRCSSVGAPGWATGLFGAQCAYAGEDRCDDRHRVRVRCRPGWPGAHSAMPSRIRRLICTPAARSLLHLADSVACQLAPVSSRPEIRRATER